MIKKDKNVTDFFLRICSTQSSVVSVFGIWLEYRKNKTLGNGSFVKLLPKIVGLSFYFQTDM